MTNKSNAKVSQAQRLAIAKAWHETAKVRQVATISEVVATTT
jgi:hypothetical protein